MHASNGILFNHEGPLRGETFVTRKITRAAAAIKLGQQECLYLGNLNAKRDWGDARDFIRGMWSILQQDEPGDWVLATGVTRTIRDFANAAFSEVDISLRWEGDGPDEVGIDSASGRTLIRVDPIYFRPTEVDRLVGDYSKAKRDFGWEPEISFDQMVADMVSRDLLLVQHGVPIAPIST
jgi:GDPmannose 4,6-dehydratase